MPTPVSTARQCLTPDASRVLDDSVAVASRRGHSQTTSLHAMSALLSSPSSVSGAIAGDSILREACTRARNSAYSARLQFKALDLCLTVSLDRLPSSSVAGENSGDEPPVSNSLMAAIKRSQANQRRQPENFSLYQQVSQQPSPLSITASPVIKVELRNLILSILDDPIVSRVFSEAGFSSPDIKLALIRPVSKLNRHPLLGFRHTFSGLYSGFCSDGDCYRRICEVLIKGRNPMLVGSCAYDTVVGFCNVIEKRKDGDQCVLPEELSRLRVVTIANLDGIDDKMQSFGVGVMVNLGDLNEFISNQSSVLSSVVAKLTRLLDQCGKKLWLIGAANSDEVYSKFVDRFPNMEKDWDLLVFPVSSWRNSVFESFPRSSLMGSFVPFGGFFTTSADVQSPLGSAYKCLSPCNLCNKKFEQETDAVSKGGFTASVADHYQSRLPSWSQMTEIGPCQGSEAQTRDDGVVLSAKAAGLQKKGDNICQRLHRSQPLGSNIDRHLFFPAFGFQTNQNRYKNPETHHDNCSKTEVAGNRSVDVKSAAPVHLKNKSRGDFEFCGLGFSNSSISNAGAESSTPLTSITSTLDLRISSLSPAKCNEPKHQSKSQDFSGSASAKIDNPERSPSLPSTNIGTNIDPGSVKMLYKDLIQRVHGQEEAVRLLSETIASCRAMNERSQVVNQRTHIWLNFAGHDRCSKRKIAVALAENIYGSSTSFIYADLNPREMNNNHAFLFWGKTLVDYIVMEISRKPLSVVLLENVDKADPQTQNNLSYAIRTGKFADSHGREVGIKNSIFVTTSCFPKNNDLYCDKEERVIQAKACPLQIYVEHAHGDEIEQNLGLSLSPNKRKLVGRDQSLQPNEMTEITKRAHLTGTRTRDLDLNLPAEEINSNGMCHADSVPDTITKNWIREFLDQVDRTIIFKPFDFDALANKLLTKINKTFQNITGLKSSICIAPEVIDQLLAAEYLSDGNRINPVDDWTDQVLGSGFVELNSRYNLDASSIVKLIACDAASAEENLNHIPGVHHLPRKITIK